MVFLRPSFHRQAGAADPLTGGHCVRKLLLLAFCCLAPCLLHAAGPEDEEDGRPQEKTRIQEIMERRQKVELMSFFLKDPKNASLPETPIAVQSYNQAVEFFQAHEYELAREAVEESLVYDKKNALAYELLGDINNLEEKLPQAKANYEIAYNLNPRPELKEKMEKLSGDVSVQKKFRTEQVEHFVIKYYREEESDRGFELKELLRSTYRQLSQDFAYYFRHKVVILLYDQADFKKIAGMPHWAAGLYDGKVRMPINRSGFSDIDLRALTAHELTHAFVASMSQGAAPAWINEGLAEYEEARIKKPDMIVFDSAVTTGTLMPLDQIMEKNVTEKLKDPLLISLFYEQSYHLVNYLIERYGMFKIKQILAEFGKGKDSEDAIREVLRISTERLEKEWKATFLKSSP
jgi:tetratricopeptide (TPR) repeat protein